jgi:hypothetical protein
MSTNTRTVIRRPTSCKVCSDAKKPESVIMSHNVKENGVVVCPTLLSQNCRYCHKTGHTISFCAQLEKEKTREKEQEKEREKVNSRKNRLAAKKFIRTTVDANVFNMLYESEEEGEVNEEPEYDVVYPSLAPFNALISNLEAATTTDTQKTYASMVIQTVEKARHIAVMPKIPDQKPKVKVPKPQNYGKWAAAESSDEEDDDEQEQQEDASAW